MLNSYSKVIKCCHSPILIKYQRFSFVKTHLHYRKFIASQYLPTSVAYTHDLAAKRASSIKQNIRPVNKFVSRTHTCGELSLANVGESVQLNGWIEFQRMRKFITLRDSYGATQLIVPDHREDLQQIINDLTYESVLSITGTVIPRPEGQTNKRMKTGDIEVQIESLQVLSKAKPNLPLFIRDFNKANETLKMKHRYLALRYPELQKNLRLRSSITAKMREYLIKECGFVDIETPTLFRRTPGGAQEFVVPTREAGKFYSLVQSPQQFKQLLMVGGFDRYFQVARCYRDEGLRYDKQPEFTQLDIEMSFVDCQGIMNLVEDLLAYSWPEDMSPLSVPFKSMTYNDSMELYGTDKPDLRIPYQLKNITNIINHSVIEESLKLKWKGDLEVYALVFQNKHDYYTKSVKDRFSEIQRAYFSAVRLVHMKISQKSGQKKSNDLFSEIMKDNVRQHLKLGEGDVLVLAVGEKQSAQELLGKLLVEFTNEVESKGQQVRGSENELLWITDFPLFSYNSEEKKLESMHHPFTHPHLEDIEDLTENPTKVRGLHYDLVMNGSEIAGGSIRIHDANLQKQILEMLNIDDTSLKHMLDGLECGAPPHGGIALGLDRLFCLLCKEQNIRSVIAFPKTVEGRDSMSDAPVSISDADKRLYHIQVLND